MKQKVNGIQLNVRDQGQGEPALLFLHYWGGSSRTWELVIDRLKTDFRCVAYDQRGWGDSDKLETGYSMQDLANEDTLKGAAPAKYAWPEKGLAEDISQAVRNVSVPTLVLAGENDQVETIDSLKSALLPNIPTARMTTIPETGHLSPLEVPDKIASEIRAFLRG